MTTFFAPRTPIVLAAVLCLAALSALWLASSPSPGLNDSQASAFIQSGGLTSDSPPGASDAAEVFRHATAPRVRGTAAAPTF